MPALKPTDFIGTITWLGHVADRDAALQSAPLTELMARFSGPEAEAHGGLTRPSCSRVTGQYKRGTEIRNTRQFSVMGAEDLAAIAREKFDHLGHEDALIGLATGAVGQCVLHGIDVDLIDKRQHAGEIAGVVGLHESSGDRRGVFHVDRRFAAAGSDQQRAQGDKSAQG